MQFKISILTFVVFCFVSIFANAARPIRGTYQVPVADELKAFADYPVKFKADNYQDIPTTISFPMPSALLGEETIFTMSKVSDQSTEWAGENIKGNCETLGRYFKCTVQFGSLTVDPKKLETSINQQYTTSEEIAGRKMVALSFGAEPIGILIYKMRGKTPIK